MIKTVVKTTPIVIKARFLVCLIPNLKRIPIDVIIIMIIKEYRPNSIKEILSEIRLESTSCIMVFCIKTSKIMIVATVINKINVSAIDINKATK